MVARVAVLGALVAVSLLLWRATSQLDRSVRRDLAARGHMIGQTVGLQHQISLARAEITALTGRLDRAATRLATTSDDLALSKAQLKDVLTLLRGTGKELRTTTEALGSARGELDKQTLQLTETQRCLDGVRHALERAAVDDFDGTVTDLEAVRGACHVALDKNQQALGGPAFNASFADPFVLHDGVQYYAYATNSVGGSIQLATGRSLSTLQLRSPAVSHLPEWARAGNTWGPSILRRGDRWVLYYTVAQRSSGISCLQAATAPSPAGPFTNQPVGLACNAALGGSIDPSPAVSRDGRAWLVWKIGGIPGRRPGQVVSQRLSEDGLRLEGRLAVLAVADQAWESGVVEGPSLVERANRWVLLYSGGDWHDASYGIGAASCAGPAGPCRKVTDRPIYDPPAPLAGAGGQEVFTGPDGTTWLAYHAWVRGQVGYPNPRRLYVARIGLDRSLPAVTPVPVAAS